MIDASPSPSLISDMADCHAAIRGLIEQPEPMFLARIGGSDSDVVIEYFDLLCRYGPEEARALILPKFGIVKLFNGYYDKSQDDRKIAQFCQLMIDIYLECPDLLMVGASLLTEFLPGTIDPRFHVDTAPVRESLRGFVAAVCARRARTRFFPYAYVERLLFGPHTMFRLFGEILPGKRVLVVSPFAESIAANFSRRRAFFPGFAYPEFELALYNTPITYHGLPADFYPDADWFATVERMKREIEAHDFDIALLSCGSYAMPLGLHIRDSMRRKAIYMGGCLQLFFGITGRRYDNPFFTDQMNVPAFILPLERKRFLPHVSIGPQTAREAFGAYF